MNWDWDLEGTAYDIAVSNANIVRVLAGPGTGKTFALMRLLARLLEEGVPADRILVCTFTRTAAADLVRQVTALGAEGATRVRVGTLHRFCFALLAQNSVFELTRRVPRPLFPFEERFLVEDLKSDFGGVRACKRFLGAFAAAWARLQCETPGWPQDADDRKFHVALKRWLEFHSAMLIGEIVPEALRFLENNPAAPQHLAYGYVLVDEYQDLNRADQKLLDVLASNGRLAVVGDSNQSVYSFRYAHPEGIGEFAQTHPGTVDFNLYECRRCPKQVIDMANRLIAHNETRWEQELQPREGNPQGEVNVVQWPNQDLEARGLALFIKKQVEDGIVGPGKILALTPRRQLGYGIRDALCAADVPAHSFFAENALNKNPKQFDGSEAQIAFTLLTLLANPNDKVALRCWCGFGHRCLHAPEWARLRAHCENSGHDPREALRSMLEKKFSIPRTTGLIERMRLLDDCLRELTHRKGKDLLDRLLPDNCDWARPLRNLTEDLEEEDYDADALLEALRIGVTQPELPTEVDYVRVMSLHKAKGLTADLVVIAGCVETLIPHIDSRLPLDQQQRSLEEQRRLFYVAITRTRRILVLSSAITMERGPAYQMRAQVGRGDATKGRTISSRFIAELGETCPDAIRGDQWLRRIIGET